MHRITMLLQLVVATMISAAIVDAAVTVYRANINKLPLGTGPLGYVTVYTESDSNYVGYAGIVNELQPNLKATTCNATNGCGVHIHSGFSCRNFLTQGGHYFVNNSVVKVDPWINARYSSDSKGKANFQGVLNIGTNKVDRKVFIVHSENGTRVGCGVIRKQVFTGANKKKLLSTKTTNLTNSGAKSKVTIYAIRDDEVCYFGKAKNLEANLTSYLNNNPVGTNCNFTNGCGVHLHKGFSCFNLTTQGPHFWNATVFPTDPWLYTMYHETNAKGRAYFAGCVETGVDGPEAFAGRAFVLHSENGTRVSCGILKN